MNCTPRNVFSKGHVYYATLNRQEIFSIHIWPGIESTTAPKFGENFGHKGSATDVIGSRKVVDKSFCGRKRLGLESVLLREKKN